VALPAILVADTRTRQQVDVTGDVT
jgi:hypothetical protein